MSLFNPRTSFISSPFSANCEWIQEPEPEPTNAYPDEEVDPVIEEKQIIVQERESKKKKRLPGQKLLKKLHKKQQVENSLSRVIKDLL